MLAETSKDKPFFVSDVEKKGLTDIAPDNLAAPLREAIPEFKDAKAGSVVGAYGMKDGFLVYHVYKADRKAIFDQAHAALDSCPDERQRSDISRQANAELEAHPWWPDTGEILDEVFSIHFRTAPHKVSYYIEVDSWSVILPEPRGVAMPGSYLAEVFEKLAARFGG